MGYISNLKHFIHRKNSFLNPSPHRTDQKLQETFRFSLQFMEIRIDNRTVFVQLRNKKSINTLFYSC